MSLSLSLPLARSSPMPVIESRSLSRKQRERSSWCREHFRIRTQPSSRPRERPALPSFWDQFCPTHPHIYRLEESRLLVRSLTPSLSAETRRISMPRHSSSTSQLLLTRTSRKFQPANPHQCLSLQVFQHRNDEWMNLFDYLVSCIHLIFAVKLGGNCLLPTGDIDDNLQANSSSFWLQPLPNKGLVARVNALYPVLVIARLNSRSTGTSEDQAPILNMGSSILSSSGSRSVGSSRDLSVFMVVIEISFLAFEALFRYNSIACLPSVLNESNRMQLSNQTSLS